MKRFFSFFAAILFAGVWMVQAATYTVAGSSETAFGTAWTPSIEANDMTLTEGLYQWEKTDLTLPAGTIEFKVCEDHAWTNCWPSQNYQLAIPEAGIYTITITFNADSKEVNAVATKTGSAVVVPSIAMHGNFLGSWADTENFTVVEGNETAVLTLNLAAGNYEFGMRIGGSGNWTSNGAAFTRENPSAVVAAGQGNLTLAADKEGTYTFTWTFASNTLAVTFPEKGDDPIVPPTPVDSMTVYYVNETAWENVDAFVWPAEGDAYKAWPGEAMTKEAEQINGFDVYSYTFPASYVNIIFNNGNGGEGNQTVDLVWEDAKPYFYDGAWYAKADIPTGGDPQEDEFVGFDARTVNLGEQIAAGLAKNLVNVTFEETSEGKYSINLVEGGVEGTFSFGGVVFAYKNSAAGTTTWKTFGTYIQPNGKDREIRIPLMKDEQVNVVLVEACEGVLVDGESMNLAAGDNLLTATADGLVLKSASTKPKIQAILPVTPEPPTTTYYMKNNWEAGADWTWKEMTQDGDIYKLENVVFGGTGVNYNTAESDEGAAWVAVDDILGDEIAAKDTVTFVLDPVKATVTATLIGKYQDGGDTPEPPTPGTVYYLKNNWEAGADWTWKEMTQDGEIYKLENVVFGGTGVNYNTAESDEGAAWVPVDDILGDEIAAKDTVTFVLDPVKATVTATLIGKYQDGGDTPEPPTPGTVYYMKNNWEAGADWTWKEMTQDGEIYKLENVVFGGTGVNYNTAESDEGAAWVAVDDILGDEIAAKDTVTFVLNPVKATVTATLIGKYVDPVTPPTPGDHTYTVAGSLETAFGTAWTPSIEANDMTLVEGLYQWEKTDLTLPAGTIEFKVCEDHAWTNCWPKDNYQLAITEAGIYTITITFNADSKEVAAVATQTGSAVVVPSIAMHGNFLGSWADTENFTVVEGNETAVLTLNLAAGNYEFGMRIGGSGNWTSNGAAFTRENPSAVVVAGQGNLTLAADKEGTYTFTWTYETNTLTITFPTTTALDNTAAQEKATKILRNGQIFILKGDKMYNVMGAVIR